MELQQPPPKYSTFDFDIETVKLSNSPQDDYQRIFFATLFEKYYSNDVAKKISINDLFNQQLNIKSTTYRSSIAKDLENPNYLTDETNIKNLKIKEFEKNSDSNKDILSKQFKRKSSIKKDKGNETLKCFEYKFPDLKIYLDESTDNNNNNNNNKKKFIITEETLKKIPVEIKKNLKINEEFCLRNMLDANVVFNDLNSTESSNIVSSSSSPSEDDEIKSITPKDNVTVAMNTLTKNQQFKVTKLDHNDASNNKLISKNNTVLWEYDTGYVFLTGIWRLYQDIIRGLILCDRRNISNEQNKLIKDKCIREYEYISSFAFYESINLNIDDDDKDNEISNISQYQDSNGKQRKRRSITNPSNANLSNIGIQINGKQKTSIDGSNKINYSDLHWNEISDTLCEIVRNDFKNHLINDQNIPIENINVDGKNINDLGKRIRGGFIKIQGTWQPMRIARRMCFRFCYPIRYLLTPLFGPDFVSECEKWYKAIEYHSEKMFEERKRTGFVGPMRSKRSIRKINNTPKNSNTSSPKGKRKASFTSSSNMEPDTKRPTLRDPFSNNGIILTPTKDLVTTPPPITPNSSNINKNNIPRVYIANSKQRGTQSLPSIQGIISSVQHISPPNQNLQIQNNNNNNYPMQGRNSVPNVHFAPFGQQLSHYPPQPLVPQVINQRQQQQLQQQHTYLPPPYQTTIMNPINNRISIDQFRSPIISTERYSNGNLIQSRNSTSNQSSNLTTPQTPDVNILSAATNLYNTGGHRYSYPPKVKVSQIEPSSKYDFAPDTHMTYIGTPKLSDVPHPHPSTFSTVTTATATTTNHVPRSYNRELPRIIPQAYISAAQYQMPLQPPVQFQPYPQPHPQHQHQQHYQQPPPSSPQQQQHYYQYQFQQPR
ncbi:similar to Saccharomyces cerevisiae YIL101C XBP1 Transcriptional repressor that binds to promoter sequences of the cyclin genes, CYS3, and SMF2 [Maudiozyma saulgeensis]|uniref:Similar to Saccharomyces cerevisiae YIL101C XBP1 Transcriptional repressor that binds to promoter sequences of the cyclin genes, CYS3, and SMF2 n=1 Tax=Maudiozyma saulgeensis TaxID=1789683 RepID=A0A1X7R9A4_9SACH|nr:similar to Saccharomyces cerevisiae YIL101C XBP1 Transcriptional repressor that binds to promoter sequences of the cyclin genes, CYS3, and SMF2 [Kazachstania saulgeensis]